MSTLRRSEAEISTLRRTAQEIAHEESRALSTVHLLAAVWRQGGAAGELLEARRLTDEAVSRAGRAYEESSPDAVEEVLALARDVAWRRAVPSRHPFSVKRGAAPGLEEAPGAIHVLIVLASHRRFAAYRALVQRGVDVARLRTAATRVALGMVQPPRDRREEERVVRVEPKGRRQAAQAENPGRPKAEAVPLIPALARQSRAVRRPPVVSRAPAEEAPPAPVQESPPPTEVPPPVESEREGETAAVEDAFDVAYPQLVQITVEMTTGSSAVIGREREVERVLDILSKKHGRAALLVGPGGVGKTSIARAAATALAAQGRVVRELLLTDLLSGATRSALIDRVATLHEELQEADGSVVLVVDDMEDYLSVDEIALEVKAALRRAPFPLIGAMSRESFQKLADDDPSLMRRFLVVEVEEPDEEEAMAQLKAACQGELSRYHEVQFALEAIEVALRWSTRYLPGRALPERALAVLDLAAARTARNQGEAVDRGAVAEVVSSMADVPVERLLERDQRRFLRLSAALKERVIGHEAASDRIAAVLRRNGAGLGHERPIGSFLLLGPTGVGKTETAKAVAEVLFDDRAAMTRLDMSEYNESHAVARLIGAPPGYVGFEAGGMLTEAVRRRPYQVLLLDELEKAHREVLQTFLQVFDEGRLTDGRGRLVDFCNVVIIATSNLGAGAMQAAMNSRAVGFSAARTSTGAEELAPVALGAARKALPPELYNRFDEVLFYGPLERCDVLAIAKRMVQSLAATLEAERGILLQVSSEAYDVLLEQGGYDPQLGARPMRRAVQRLVEAPLSDLLLAGRLARRSRVSVTVVDDGLHFEIAAAALAS